MSENPRIDNLKRRVEKDPSSIAFAQLAEEYRRAGQCKEAVAVCEAGLAIHPGYLSAHVTLGRALLELGELERAQQELALVLKGAPENLAALRGLAEIHHRRGVLADALSYYRSALALARNDPELEQTVSDLARTVEPQKPAGHDGLSLEQMGNELAKHSATTYAAPVEMKPAAAPPLPAAAVPAPPVRAASKPTLPAPASFVPASPVAALPAPASAGVLLLAPPAVVSSAPAAVSAPEPAPPVSIPPAPPPVDPHRERALRQIDALEQWLAAVDAARPDRNA
jgi:tetratricopeptide (TPR) repeat protein